MDEIEAKYLDIDIASLEAKLVALGAVKEFDRVYRIKVYDYADLRLNAENAWIRVRDEGDKIRMGFKQRQGKGAHGDTGMYEVEMTVDDFDKAWTFLEKIGLTLKFDEEKRRIRYRLGDVEFDLDTMPLLKPYLEVEGPSWEAIDAAAQSLGLNPADKKICSAFQIYEMQGMNQLDYQVLTFEKQVKRSQS